MLTLRPKPDPNSPRQTVDLPPSDNAPDIGGQKELISQGFFANLKDFLTERPVKVPKGAQPAAFEVVQTNDGFVANLKAAFHRGPKISDADAASLRGSDSPGIKVEHKSFLTVFAQNIRDLVAPPKLPPLKTTSAPVKVKDIWSKDELFSRSQLISIGVHVAFGVLLLVPILKVAQDVKANNKVNILITPVDVSPYTAKLAPAKNVAHGGGGGGEHNPIPASHGKLPKFSMQAQLAPPALPRNPHPALMVVPTLIGPDNLKVPNINSDHWGDPLAKFDTDSNGPGSGGGMGSGSGGGIGSGKGGGLGPGEGGGTGGGIFNAGTGGVGNPECMYCPRPDYSDEARKAKYQGDVLLSVVVLPNGKASDIEVIKSPGMGLDQKAIEAVRTWQFKPANGPDGKPVKARVQVIVTFQLF